MRYILSIILITSSITLFGQFDREVNETTRTTIQKQQMEKGQYYHLDKLMPEHSTSGNPVYELSLFGKDNELISKTVLNEHIRSNSNPIEALYMQFISVNTGFIYGYEHGFGFFPKLYKTVDGGKTWNSVLFEAIKPICPLSKSSFHMFNQKQGIIIVNPAKYQVGKEYHQNHFDYFITNDGGLTWEKKSLDLTNQNIEVVNYEDSIQSIFKQNGTIVSIISKDDKTVVLRSDDFGATFKVLK